MHEALVKWCSRDISRSITFGFLVPLAVMPPRGASSSMEHAFQKHTHRQTERQMDEINGRTHRCGGGQEELAHPSRQDAAAGYCGRPHFTVGQNISESIGTNIPKPGSSGKAHRALVMVGQQVTP